MHGDKALEIKMPTNQQSPAPLLIVAPKAVTPDRHQAIKNIEKLYGELLFDFDLSHAFRGLPITLTAEDIINLPEIQIGQPTSPYPDPFHPHVRPLTEADLQGHTAARGLNEKGQAFIVFKRQSKKQGLKIVTILNNQEKDSHYSCWLTCERTTDNTKEFFEWYYSNNVRYTRSRDIANLMCVLGISKHSPRRPTANTEYKDLFCCVLTYIDPTPYTHSFDDNNFYYLPEIGVLPIPNPSLGQMVRIYTKDILKGHAAVRGVNEEEGQPFVLFSSGIGEDQKITTLVCFQIMPKEGRAAKKVWMSYQRAADDKSEFCRVSAMNSVSSDDILALIGACAHEKDYPPPKQSKRLK